MTDRKTVIVLGASGKPDKYSFQAVKLLAEKGYDVIPVHPSGMPVNGISTIRDLSGIKGKKIDTISLYVNPGITRNCIEGIIALAPRRIIFNPGTEDDSLSELFDRKGILTEKGCTLVMLKTNSF